MNLTRFTRTAKFLSLAMLVGTIGANASTLTYYVDIFSGNPAQLTLPTGTGVPTQSTADAGPFSVFVPQFDTNDPNPGHAFQLTSVTFTLLEASVATVAVNNIDATGKATTATAAACFAAGGDHWVSGANGCTGIPKTDTFTQLNATMPLSIQQVGYPNVAVSTTDTTAPDKSGVAAAGHYLTVTEPTAGDCTAAGGFLYNSSTHACSLPFIVSGVTTFSGLTGSGSNSTSITNFLNLFESQHPVNIAYDAAVGDISVHGTETSGNGALQFSGFGTAGGIFEVQYNYTEIITPEPASMVLIGSSILTLGLLLRRKQRRP
jgi:hypothetical protein